MSWNLRSRKKVSVELPELPAKLESSRVALFQSPDVQLSIKRVTESSKKTRSLRCTQDFNDYLSHLPITDSQTEYNTPSAPKLMTTTSAKKSKNYSYRMKSSLQDSEEGSLNNSIADEETKKSVKSRSEETNVKGSKIEVKRRGNKKKASSNNLQVENVENSPTSSEDENLSKKYVKTKSKKKRGKRKRSVSVEHDEHSNSDYLGDNLKLGRTRKSRQKLRYEEGIDSRNKDDYLEHNSFGTNAVKVPSIQINEVEGNNTDQNLPNNENISEHPRRLTRSKGRNSKNLEKTVESDCESSKGTKLKSGRRKSKKSFRKSIRSSQILKEPTENDFIESSIMNESNPLGACQIQSNDFEETADLFSDPSRNSSRERTSEINTSAMKFDSKRKSRMNTSKVKSDSEESRKIFRRSSRYIHKQEEPTEEESSLGNLLNSTETLQNQSNEYDETTDQPKAAFEPLINRKSRNRNDSIKNNSFRTNVVEIPSLRINGRLLDNENNSRRFTRSSSRGRRSNNAVETVESDSKGEKTKIEAEKIHSVCGKSKMSFRKSLRSSRNRNASTDDFIESSIDNEPNLTEGRQNQSNDFEGMNESFSELSKRSNFKDEISNTSAVIFESDESKNSFRKSVRTSQYQNDSDLIGISFENLENSIEDSHHDSDNIEATFDQSHQSESNTCAMNSEESKNNFKKSTFRVSLPQEKHVADLTRTSQIINEKKKSLEATRRSDFETPSRVLRKLSSVHEKENQFIATGSGEIEPNTKGGVQNYEESNVQNASNNSNGLEAPRITKRKRWSAEIRKMLSTIDVSSQWISGQGSPKIEQTAQSSFVIDKRRSVSMNDSLNHPDIMDITQENKDVSKCEQVVKTRRTSMRKRWSDEIRNSMSLTNLSTPWVCSENVEGSEETSGLSKRRSTSMNEGLNVSHNMEAAEFRERRRTFELEEPKNDISTLMSLSQVQNESVNEGDTTFEDEKSMSDMSALVLSGNDNKMRRTKSIVDTVNSQTTSRKFSTYDSICGTRLSNYCSSSEDSRTESKVEDETTNLPPSTNKKVRFQFITMRRGKQPQVKPPTEQSKRSSVFQSNSFDMSCFSPPKMASTPYVNSKSTLLKQVLTKDTKIPKRRSKSLDEVNEKIKRTKLPNFAKIHAKAADRMENIAQLAERKAERARLLMSGQKPTSSTSEKPVEVVKKSQKQLVFNQPTTSTNKGFLRVIPEPKYTRVVERKDNFSPKPGPSKATVSGPPVQRKIIAKPILAPKSAQLGLKPKSKAVDNKTEQIKAVVTKTQPQKDVREDRRIVLKGVRGNRRFELLMKMRKK